MKERNAHLKAKNLKQERQLTQVTNESGPNCACWAIEMACGIVNQLHRGGILMGGNAQLENRKGKEHSQRRTVWYGATTPMMGKPFLSPTYRICKYESSLQSFL